MHIYNNATYVVGPDEGKVLMNKKTKIIRASQFKLNANETPDDYIDVIGIEVQGLLFGYNPNLDETAVTQLIRNRYSLDDELALLNNINSDSHLVEYQEFLQFRQDCKDAVKKLKL